MVLATLVEQNEMKTFLTLFCLLVWCANAFGATATNWFVNGAAADDSGSGLTAATAFKTLKAAVITNCSAAATIYVAPGIYREQITLTKSGAAGADVITVQGDPRNEKGFAGVTPGPVRWTGHPTNDKTDATGIPLNVSTFDYWTWNDLWIDGGDNYAVTSANGAIYHSFNRCFCSSVALYAINLLVATDTEAYWTIANSILIGYNGLRVTPQATPTSAELNLEIAINNSVIYGPSAAVLIIDKAGTYPFAGVDIDSCTMFGNIGFLYGSMSSNAGTIKNSITRCIFFCASGILTTATKSFVTEDYNCFHCTAVRSSGESAGAHDQYQYAMLYDFGQNELWFGRPKTFMRPYTYGPAAGLDTSAAGLATDLLGRKRPSGGGPTWGVATPAVGAYEPHDFGTKEVTVVDSGSAIKLIGPGDHQIVVPVKAQSTVLTVKAAYGNLYTGTKPQANLIADPSLGITAETVTAVGAVTNTFETLTFAAQTPSAVGAVTIRLISNDTAGTGQSWFDTVTRNY